MLDQYLTGSHGTISSVEVIDKITLAGDLLRELNTPETNIIHGLNILNFAAIQSVHSDPQKLIPVYIASQTKSPIGAANLCLNDRSLATGEDRATYDHILTEAANTLVNVNEITVIECK